MSIALTHKVKELEALVKELMTRVEALECDYNESQPVTIDPPKRRGRRPKNHEND